MRSSFIFTDLFIGDEFTCSRFHGETVFTRNRFYGVNKDTGEEVEFELEDPVELIHRRTMASCEALKEQGDT